MGGSKSTALKELIYILADDDFITSHRGSEWLGLAPHIEEDVAYSSITQDTMGHAVMFYKMLEELGEGKADDISHLRKPNQYRNAILLEEVNGPGSYLHEPHYDWAFTVVRNYFYTTFKTIRIEALKQSSYEPLADLARKIAIELQYHHLHWETWFRQLLTSTDEARKRMTEAIHRCWSVMDGVISLGPKADQMSEEGLIVSEEVLRQKWLNKIEVVLKDLQVKVPDQLRMTKGNGRQGEHTEDLEEALKTLSEVFKTDTMTAW